MVTFRELLFHFVWILTITSLTHSEQIRIPIGVVLGKSDSAAEQSLHSAMAGEVQEGSVSFQLHTENTDLMDSYLLSQSLNRLLDNSSIAALVVPSVSPVVAWWASRFTLPVVSLRSTSLPSGTPQASIEVSPDSLLALIDVMRYYKWSSIHYFYQDDEGLQRLQTLQQVGSGALNLSSWFLHRVEDSHTGRSVLMKLDVAQISSRIFVALDLEPDLASQVLSEVSRTTSLEKSNFHFLLFKPADDSLWHQPFLKDLSVSGLCLYDPKAVPEELQISRQRNLYGSTTQWLLARDSARLLSEAFDRLYQNEPTMVQEMHERENKKNPLPHGSTLITYLRETSFSNGSTPGALQFDSNGKRRAFVLDILESTPDGPVKAFSWSDATGLNVISPSYGQKGTGLTSRTYIVTSALHIPYLTMKKDADNLSGNDQYEGYIKDLLVALSEQMKFNFELKIVKDGTYGRQMPNGKWSGMIGEVINHEADMALSDITITSKRQEVVDFSTPFMTVGISLMVKRPTYTDRSSESAAYFFLHPFAPEVWGCLFVALVVVGLSHFAIGRVLSKVDPSRQSRSSTLMDSIWFAFGSLFLRQTGLQPKSYSSRVLSGVWWVFAFFVLALYVTSLVSIMVSNEMGVSGLSREEAVAQKSAIEIIQESVDSGFPKIGVIRGGSTEGFFKYSNEVLYRRFWESLKSNPELAVLNNRAGAEKVVQGNGEYAFLMESSANEYISMRECRTLMIPQLLDSKGYGIVTAKGSALGKAINGGLMALMEQGQLQSLYSKWWKPSNQCQQGQATKKMKDLYHSSMNMSDVAGVFYLLVAGALLTLLVALGEVLYSRRAVRVGMHRVALTNVSTKSESDQLNGEGLHGDRTSI